MDFFDQSIIRGSENGEEEETPENPNP